MRPKSLMTHYVEGSIISRELENMMLDYAANARFDTELSDLEFWVAAEGTTYAPKRRNVQ